MVLDQSMYEKIILTMDWAKSRNSSGLIKYISYTAYLLNGFRVIEYNFTVIGFVLISNSIQKNYDDVWAKKCKTPKIAF